MPILTVNEKTGGGMSRLPFSFERTMSDAPLKILIADDTPSGSGASIRSSVWLAAVTAAMQRNDPMNGVRITVEFSGNVDGPSAGGVMCLSILSAMDGRSLPKDFAMTGTIMPDGTIGVVGGVAQKMRAAIAGGCTRICIPGFLRFEKQDDGRLVDLFRIGEKEHVEVRPVRSVAEAYAFAHRLPVPASRAINESSVLTLPRRVEDVLIEKYLHCEREGRRLRARVSKSNQKNLEEDGLYSRILFDDEGTRQYVSGRLLPASTSAETRMYAWSAAESWEKKLGDIGRRYPVLVKEGTLSQAERTAFVAALKNLQKDFSKEANAIFRQVNPDPKSPQPGTLGYVRDAEDLSEIAAQGESSGENLTSIAGILWWLKQASVDLTKEKNFSEADLSSAFEFEGRKVFLLLLGQRCLAGTAEDDTRPKMFRKFPGCRSNRRIGRVEKLFYSAWTAVDEAISADIVNDHAEKAEVRESDVVDVLASKDFFYAGYTFAKARARITHSWIDQPDLLADHSYHVAAMLSINASIFAQACTFLVKFGADIGGDFNDNDDYVCSNTEFLNYLVRRAREHALAAIDECVRAEIPCPSAQEMFEAADGFDVTTTDADGVFHNVLENYWGASLGAKALLMGFAPAKIPLAK